DHTTTDYAFNYHAIAYDHGLTNRQHRVKLRVRGHSNLTLDFGNRTVQGRAYHTPPTQPSPEEGELGEGGEVMLFVGYAPTTFTPNAADSRKSRSKISLLKKPRVVSFDPQVLRIVVTLSSEMAYTHALVDQKDGLCSAWRHPNDRCFFFPEFRDDELTTISERKSAWNKLMREAEDDSTITLEFSDFYGVIEQLEPTNSTALEERYQSVLNAIIHRHKELIAYGERYNQALKSLVSDDLGADPHNIWANFAGSMDFGRMKLWAMQAHRWIAKQSVVEDVGNLTKLKEFTETLEKLRGAVF
ncbi:MAG: hypothetical protein Q9176_004788, partial [Flavoplaca citrina]